jgi:hypothetical protein
MKYIQLDLLINLIKDIADLIAGRRCSCNYYKQWFYATYIYKFNKKYKKYIITKYTNSYNNYVEYISLGIFKGFTTILEDYIYNDNWFSDNLDDKLKDDVCIFIHRTRSDIIKNTC